MTADLIARAKAALSPDMTPGPWVVNTEGWAVISSGPDSVIHGYVDTSCENCGADVKGDADVAISIEDAGFIAAARTLVPELVAAFEDMQADRDQARHALLDAGKVIVAACEQRDAAVREQLARELIADDVRDDRDELRVQVRELTEARDQALYERDAAREGRDTAVSS